MVLILFFLREALEILWEYLFDHIPPAIHINSDYIPQNVYHSVYQDINAIHSLLSIQHLLQRFIFQRGTAQQEGMLSSLSYW
jgi:hypothetical protein